MILCTASEVTPTLLVAFGFTLTDIDTVSDRLVDALVTWGSPAEIAAKAYEHRAAGADHVQLTVLHNDHQPGSVEAARLLAPLLLNSTPRRR
jgi:hypothetical protein